MKTICWIVAIFLVSPTIAFADNWRKTTGEFYMGGQNNESEEQMMNWTAAQVRVEAYRALYEY